MRTLRKELRGVMLALAVLAYLTTATVRAEERAAGLRGKALKLNQVTGNHPIAGEVLALLDDKAAARKLVSEAARLAKEKPQPFSYNATLILAMTASQVKDLPAAETFYRLHRDQAKQLRSVRGLITAYSGLITTLFATKNYAEAEKICEEALEHQTIGSVLLRLQRETGRDAEAERKPIERFRTLVVQEHILAIAYQGDSDRAVEVIDKLFKDPSSNWLSLDLKGRVFRIVGKNEEAIKVYENELELLQKDDKLSKEDKESLLKDTRYSLLRAYVEANQIDKAVKFYEDELERLQKDDKLSKEDKENLIKNTRYVLSGVYIEANQVDKAAEQLKTLLEKYPDDPTYNNDLGYIWADHDMNLAESEKLIRKAIEEERKQRHKDNPNLKPGDDKDNAAHLDSLGWVLYKQKKYQDAKKYLQQAVEQEDGKHVEILDHLGDILMALGEKTEAVAAWKKGIKMTGDSKREQKRKEEVLKKIKANE